MILESVFNTKGSIFPRRDVYMCSLKDEYWHLELKSASLIFISFLSVYKGSLIYSIKEVCPIFEMIVFERKDFDLIEVKDYKHC